MMKKIALFLLLSSGLTGWSQTNPVPSTVNTNLSNAELSLVLKPLTRDELATESQAWRDALKSLVAEISAGELAVRNATNENQKVALLDSLAEKRDAKVVYMDGLRTTIRAWQAKGGEVEEMEQYLSAVAGTDVDVSDGKVVWTVVRDWVLSPQGGQRVLIQLAKFIGILFLASIIGRVLGKLTGKALSKAKGRSSLLVVFLEKAVRRVIIIIGFIMALSAIGVNTGPLLAGIGATGFILGFALQDTLGNFASGIMILLNRPFDIGDVVDVAGVSGVVGSVSISSTGIKTFDNKEIIIPNKKVWGDIITNATKTHTRRVDMTFGIGYDDDISKVQEILERIVNNHEKVLNSPAPTIKLHELADSSVNFIVRPWVKNEDYWGVYWDITREVKVAFDEAGITIPYPQQEVHMRQVNS